MGELSHITSTVWGLWASSSLFARVPLFLECWHGGYSSTATPAGHSPLGMVWAMKSHAAVGRAAGIFVISSATQPWPGPMKSRAGPDIESGLPPSPHAASVSQAPPSPSRLGRSSGSGSGDARSIRVLGRSGEVLYTARTRQAVRTWLKRNLDREKRKGALVEDKPRSKRRLKKPPTPGPKGGAVSRTPKPASEV